MSEAGGTPVLGVCGSLRVTSYDRAILRTASELKPPGMTIETAEIGAVPLYDEDVRAQGFPDEAPRQKPAQNEEFSGARWKRRQSTSVQPVSVAFPAKAGDRPLPHSVICPSFGRDRIVSSVARNAEFASTMGPAFAKGFAGKRGSGIDSERVRSQADWIRSSLAGVRGCEGSLPDALGLLFAGQ